MDTTTKFQSLAGLVVGLELMAAAGLATAGVFQSLAGLVVGLERAWRTSTGAT